MVHKRDGCPQQEAISCKSVLHNPFEWQQLCGSSQTSTSGTCIKVDRRCNSPRQRALPYEFFRILQRPGAAAARGAGHARRAGRSVHRGFRRAQRPRRGAEPAQRSRAGLSAAHAIEHGLLRSGVVAGLGDAHLAKALNAMHAAPERPWTLQGLADLAGMSRARFAAHFGEVVGEPAIEYLAGWRLSVAQGLLTQGRQVKSIADEVGYGSPNALTRAFTQRLGQTPTEWLAQRIGRVPA